MVNSMTGFAALTGETTHTHWSWEIRSVNARGLDFRPRLPEGFVPIEQALRKIIADRFARGNISLTLKVEHETSENQARLNLAQLQKAIAAVKEVEEAAGGTGVHLTASSAVDILALRSIWEAGGTKDEVAQAELLDALKKQMVPLIDSFANARAAEGRALAAVLDGQLSRVKALVSEAEIKANARQGEVKRTLQENLARVLDNSAGADEDRVAQELALLAVKADVAEEIDRLRTHVAAAADLLATKGPIGRKFDFLMQEFNREANTLCSKSGSSDLTRIGLDLKVVIDQMREQVQNVE